VISFEAFSAAGRTACLSIFEANCPDFFAPNERDEYVAFLDEAAPGYVVCRMDDVIVGAFGLANLNVSTAALHWILIAPGSQGRGLGSAIMARALDDLRSTGRSSLRISASHRSAPFFARFRAQELERHIDGWGPGMHRVEMRITLI
jgi:GNAT superfamily N-acetyltransferase